MRTNNNVLKTIILIPTNKLKKKKTYHAKNSAKIRGIHSIDISMIGHLAKKITEVIKNGFILIRKERDSEEGKRDTLRGRDVILVAGHELVMELIC